MDIKDIKTVLDLEEWLAKSELAVLVQQQAQFMQLLEGRIAPILKNEEELRRDMDNLTERIRKMVN